VEALAALILLVGVTVTSFATGELVIYLLFPILFWVAIRFRQPGIVIAGLLASSAAIWFTARGNGPFIGGSDDAELLRSQLFVGVATVTGLVVAALATERSRVLEQLHFLAGHDSLTGLVNRRRFAEELDRWLSFRDRYGGGGAVLVIDVDHFKEVNDTLGHSVGDEMLATVAKLLRNRLRKSDVIARLGGDEFVVLLPTADEDDALKVAEDLRQTVHDYGPVVSSAGTVGVTVTIGVGPLQSGDIDADAVVRRADAAMYEGKHAGRDRVLLELAPVAAPPPV
jgi:diguanylate cyclase (GGDEF)-like protein